MENQFWNAQIEGTILEQILLSERANGSDKDPVVATKSPSVSSDSHSGELVDASTYLLMKARSLRRE